MTKITDLFDSIDLLDEMTAGYVRSRNHPDNAALVILNYTEKAQYEKHWTDVTRQSRGLIVDRVSGNVLARPFDKFFNVGEHLGGEMKFDPDTPVRCVDKLDGSLGIYYVGPDGLPAIATRGSFTSDQAQHATRVLRERYSDFRPRAGWTPLFEIIYPENRIVLDYGNLDDLVLLGQRNVETGRIVGPDHEPFWFGPRAETLPPRTFGEAIAFGDRTNREGMVVTFEATGLMVKIKQEDYVALHRLVTGLNERVVWEHMSTHNGSALELAESIPDEFHDWLDDVSSRLLDRFDVLQGRAHAAYHEIVAEMESGGLPVWPSDKTDRARFARAAKERGDLTPLLFQLLDGRDISASIWKTLKPKGQTESLMNRTEDNS